MTKAKVTKVIVFIVIIVILASLLPKCKTSDNFFLKIYKDKKETIDGNRGEDAIDIQGDKYYLIYREIEQEYYAIMETPPSDLISSEYYMLNASTNEKMYPSKNMYVLSKEGLKKTNIFSAYTLASNEFVHNGNAYYIIDYPIKKPITDCKVDNIKYDVPKEKSPDDRTEYTYIARFDKAHNRFIIDASAAYKESDYNAFYQHTLDEQEKYPEDGRENPDNFVINYTKKFDCSN